MNDTNKQKAVAAIWENPAPAFGCNFRQSGKFWENADRGGEYDERGKIRLAQSANGGNITVFYNGGSRPEHLDVFTYLQDYALHTAGFRETLERLAELYEFTLEYSAEERQRINREALAREVAPCLVEALRMNPDGEAATYLTNVRGLQADGVHFGELSEQAITRVTEYLKNKGFRYDYNDLTALGLTKAHAAQGYALAIPYYRNGTVKGFVLRNVRKEHNGPKYLYSEGLGRGGYCDALRTGEPAVIVEGQMDAVRLTQSGVKNVIAMGGAKISEDIAKLLKARNISQITYVPDLEYNDKGIQKTDIIADAIKAFQSAKVDGEQVVTALYVAELSAPENADRNGLKVDADTYGKEHGGAALAEAVELAATWYDWELRTLINTAIQKENETGKDTQINWFCNKFDELYKRCTNPYERERIKKYIEGKPAFENFGITPQALADVDEWNRNRQYTDRVKAATHELQQAVENGANPVQISEAVQKLIDTQAANTREEWEQQLTQTFADELDAIRNQPDTLRTKWELGNINKAGEYFKYSNIEFWPADISVFCAATSHGKTAMLFQSVLDLVKRYPTKTFLYVSCEENKRQLLERALNVYMDIQTTTNGKTFEAENVEAGKYCFISQTRKKTIKAILRDDCPPREYDSFMNVSEHYKNLSAQVRGWINKYETEIWPRLKFIHTEGTAESIAANVLHFISEYQKQGIEVGGIFVDYMQLLTSEVKSYSRHDELKDVCKVLKGCAATTEIPVVIAAQLNREAITTGIDGVTVANIGEGADIERIAHDIWFIWNTDKTKVDLYFESEKGKVKDATGDRDAVRWNAKNAKDRVRRIFCKPDELAPNDVRELKRGFLYCEHMKARDGKTDGWGLFPFEGERGYIGENDKAAMRR